MKTFDKMDAVCVDYANRIDKCQCSSVLLDSDNIKQHLSNHSKIGYLSMIILQEPESFTYDENSCITSFECPYLKYVIFPDGYEFSQRSLKLECDLNTSRFTVQMAVNGKNITETVPIAYIACYPMQPPRNPPIDEPIINFLYFSVSNFT
ncbi:Protein CBG26691 [Caenorhabditis briggsae]|uniref:Protein CBG26691 n=1 Tax=Caenorhabditis briggsae TaxID=6238 RepID=B6IE63_CAEBR|nr:Protein CBG26691 [Caenorhabditis briggsae]CAS01127.1 Protein CBG26691 [Caenorhabditis briggsae]